MAKLTKKQAKFVKEYKLNGGNATKAAKDAGYSEKTAFTIGCENLKKPYIAEAIGKEEKKLQEKFDYTVQEMFKEIATGMDMAQVSNNPNAYLKGVEMKGKAFGLFVDKVKGEINLTQALVVFDKVENAPN